MVAVNIFKDFFKGEFMEELISINYDTPDRPTVSEPSRMTIKADYIDKTYAKSIVKAILHMQNITPEAAADLICGAIEDDTSAEDVIRITHCRDCYWFVEGFGCGLSRKDYHYDPDYEDPPILPDCNPDDYCSRAKPKGVFKQ